MSLLPKRLLRKSVRNKWIFIVRLGVSPGDATIAWVYERNMIKVILVDEYDGVSNILIKFPETSGKIFEVLQDFMDVVGDTLSDESSIIASRRLNTFLKRIGYPTEMNSPDPAGTVFKLDLPSGNISPSTELGEQINMSDVRSTTPVISPEELGELKAQESMPEISAEQADEAMRVIPETEEQIGGR